jgi:hypothetical protein
MLCDFLKGRTFSILRCLQQVHELGTHIEVFTLSSLQFPRQLNMIVEQILKESQHREIASRRVAISYPTSVVSSS